MAQLTTSIVAGISPYVNTDSCASERELALRKNFFFEFGTLQGFKCVHATGGG